MTTLKEVADAIRAVRVGGIKQRFSDEYAMSMAEAAVRASGLDVKWDNEPKLQAGRPYDGAIERDGQIIIPR